MHTYQKGYSARYVPHLESRGFISSKRMQIYENMSKVVHMDFSLRQDFSLTSIIYIYLVYRHLIAPAQFMNSMSSW